MFVYTVMLPPVNGFVTHVENYLVIGQNQI